MNLFPHRSNLTQEERAQRRQLIWKDSIALVSLFALTAVLFVLTYLIFRSFERHRKELALRWLRRGELALHNGQPTQAIEALRSALAYTPGQRSTEIELAEALAAAGPRRTREAVSYFNSLREAEPGNGLINLQLARLAARQGEESAAIQYYQASLDGTWTGDGYVRRRQVRLELAQYLIDRNRYDLARDELITAAGNAPDDPQVLGGIAALMEAAQDPWNALRTYRAVLKHEPRNIAALEGSGRAAFALGFYLQARDRLKQALDLPGAHPAATEAQDRSMLETSEQVLMLYPSPRLRIRDRAQRVLTARAIAQQRLRACMPGTSTQAGSGGAAPAAKAVAAAPAKALSAADQGSLNGLAVRWRQQPARVTVLDLERDPELEQNQLQLIYDTEKTASLVCGPATGNDAILLRIAQAPEAVEQQ